MIKAATLAALCAYAAVGGILDIVNGGREVAVGLLSCTRPGGHAREAWG